MKSMLKDSLENNNRLRLVLSGVILAIMPVLGCFLWVLIKGGSPGSVFLGASPWNDELIYYKQIEQKYNTRSLPSFFVGDMNARPTYDAIATFKLHWKDSYDVVASDKKSGPENTYNGFTATQGKYRLDYVFCRGDKYKVNAYCVNNKLYNGRFASDHFPVYADVTINK